jgi:hypothetical protein
MKLVGRTANTDGVWLAYRMCGATEYTLVYAGVCKTLVDCLRDPHPELRIEGEMIQPVFRGR